jgi:hypothetical protein
MILCVITYFQIHGVVGKKNPSKLMSKQEEEKLLLRPGVISCQQQWYMSFQLISMATLVGPDLAVWPRQCPLRPNDGFICSVPFIALFH